LQGVDEDEVGCVASGEARDPHHSRNLADHNVEGRACHEGREGGERDDIDDPSAADKADEQDDGAGEDSKGGSNDMAIDVRQSFGQVGNNAAGQL
jgi:hypothetical protein